MLKKIKNIANDVKSVALITRRKYLKERLTTTIIKLSLVVICCIVAIYAWFVKNEETKFEKLSVNTKEFIELEISLDEGKTWTKTSNIKILDDYIFSNEVTSDGISFYKANLKYSDGTPKTFTKAVKDKDYIEFDIYFKSSFNIDVYLEKNTNITPSAGIEEEKLYNSSNVVRKAQEGNFSKDLICAATRLAFIPKKNIDNKLVLDEKPKLIFAPNRQVNITKIDNSEYNVNLNSTQYEEYKYINVTNDYTYQEEYLENVIDYINTSYEDNVYDNNTYLFSLNSDDNIDQNIGIITVRMWIEGTDNEAITALKGGLFDLNLSFIGVINK